MHKRDRKLRLGFFAIAIAIAAVVLVAVFFARLTPPPDVRDAVATATATAPSPQPEAPPDLAPASSPERAALEAPPDATAEPLLFRVRGTVADERGSPVDGFVITLCDAADGRELASVISPPGTTQHAYSLAADRAGTFRLTCVGSRFLAQRIDVELTPAAPEVHLELRLAYALQVKIRFVTPGGERLAHARIPGLQLDTVAAVATRTPPGDRVRRDELCGHTVSVTDVLLRFGSIEAEQRMGRDGSTAYDDILRLEAPPPIWVSAVIADVVLATQQVPAMVDTIDLVIDPAQLDERLATIKVRVLDAESRQPIADAQVKSAPTVPIAYGVFGRAEMEPDGTFVLRHLVPARHAIYASTGEHEQWYNHARVRRGTTLDLGTVYLTKRATVRGRVTDPTGRGLAGNCGLVAHIEHPLAASSFRTVDRIDESSRFTLEVGRGRHLLVIDAEPWALALVPIDTTAGSIDDLRIQLASGTRVTLRAGTWPPAWGRVAIATQEGFDVKFLGLDHGRLATEVVLPPGPYLVHVYDRDDALLATIPFAASGDATLVTLDG